MCPVNRAAYVPSDRRDQAVRSSNYKCSLGKAEFFFFFFFFLVMVSFEMHGIPSAWYFRAKHGEQLVVAWMDDLGNLVRSFPVRA